MDYLNPCNKNQTAKILERFFYVSNGREYISVIPDEAERITKLPTLDEVKEDTNRVVTYARIIVQNIILSMISLPQKRLTCLDVNLVWQILML